MKKILTASVLAATVVTSAIANNLTDNLKEIASNSTYYFQAGGGTVRGTNGVIFSGGAIYKNFGAQARIAKNNLDINLNYTPITYKINDSITVFSTASLYYSKYKYNVTTTQTETTEVKGGEPGETTTTTTTSTETKKKSKIGFGIGGGLVLTKFNNLVIGGGINNNAELTASVSMPIPFYKHFNVTYTNSWLTEGDRKLDSHYIGIDCYF